MAINELAHRVNRLLIDTNIEAENYDRTIKNCIRVNREITKDLEALSKRTDDDFINNYNKGYADALKAINERLLKDTELEEDQVEEIYKWKTI